MTMTYATYVSTIETIIEEAGNSDFTSVIPDMINYAELRIYRDFDFLYTVTRNTANTLTANSRDFSLPAAVIVMQDINVITPAGAPTANSGKRNPLVAVSKEVVDALYPDTSSTGVPSMFAMIDNSSIILGPPPDAAYMVETIYTVRPTPLSSTNTTTFLTAYMPDIFLAASLVWAFGYQRDFGGQSDNPQTAQSWESQYQMLKAGVSTEELRKKFMSWGWTSQSPSQIATPPRAL